MLVALVLLIVGVVCYADGGNVGVGVVLSWCQMIVLWNTNGLNMVDK